MNKSVYIESSVISYLTARPSRDLVIAAYQAVTAEWWDDHRLRYDVYVSPLVVQEISAGDASAAQERLRVIADIPSVAIAAEAESLASAYWQRMLFRLIAPAMRCIFQSLRPRGLTTLSPGTSNISTTPVRVLW